MTVQHVVENLGSTDLLMHYGVFRSRIIKISANDLNVQATLRMRWVAA